MDYVFEGFLVLVCLAGIYVVISKLRSKKRSQSTGGGSVGKRIPPGKE